MPYPKGNYYKYSLDAMLNASDDHLDKECCRRGITRQYMRTKADKVLAIIRHDAYYEGANDQKRGNLLNAWHFSQSSPVEMVEQKPKQEKPKQKPKTEPKKERRDYLLRDWQENETTYLKLTDDQARLMTWLLDRCFLSEMDFEEADDIEFVEV